MIILNPGSTVAMSGNGWTNTYEKAFQHATDWLLVMKRDNINDVSIVCSDGPDSHGMWRFTLRHNVTGKQVSPDIHGIDNIDAYMKQCVFRPRIYWNGSSCGEPQLTDFLCDGYEIVIRKKDTTAA